MLTIKSFCFNPFQENTYVLSDSSGQCMIIDPGCYYDQEKEELEAYIASGKLNPVMLVNTHCHLDHIFGNAFVSAKYSLPLHMHEKEVPVLDYAPAAGLMYNVPFENYSGTRIFIEEDRTISLGNHSFQVLFTPGHSPGSISLYCAARQFLISGDVLFRRSVGRTDLPGGDAKVLMDSIRNKLFTLPEGTVVYSGHGPETTIGEEIRENPFLNGEYSYFS